MDPQSSLSVVSLRNTLPLMNPAELQALVIRGNAHNTYFLLTSNQHQWEGEEQVCFFSMSLLTGNALGWTLAIWDSDLTVIQTSFTYFAQLIRNIFEYPTREGMCLHLYNPQLSWQSKELMRWSLFCQNSCHQCHVTRHCHITLVKSPENQG